MHNPKRNPDEAQMGRNSGTYEDITINIVAMFGHISQKPNFLGELCSVEPFCYYNLSQLMVWLAACLICTTDDVVLFCFN